MANLLFSCSIHLILLMYVQQKLSVTHQKPKISNKSILKFWQFLLTLISLIWLGEELQEKKVGWEIFKFLQFQILQSKFQLNMEFQLTTLKTLFMVLLLEVWLSSMVKELFDPLQLMISKLEGVLTKLIGLSKLSNMLINMALFALLTGNPEAKQSFLIKLKCQSISDLKIFDLIKNKLSCLQYKIHD